MILRLDRTSSPLLCKNVFTRPHLMQKKSVNKFWSTLMWYCDRSARVWFCRKKSSKYTKCGTRLGWRGREGEGERGRGKIEVSVLVSTHVLCYDQQYGRGLSFLSSWIFTKNDFYFFSFFLFTKSLRKRKKRWHQCLSFWRPFQVSLT
jgi:hypothetical protein